MSTATTITGYMTISEGYAEVLALQSLVKKLQDEAIYAAAGYPSTHTVWLIIDGVPRKAHPGRTIRSNRGNHIRWSVTPTSGEHRIGFDVPIASTLNKEGLEIWKLVERETT